MHISNNIQHISGVVADIDVAMILAIVAIIVVISVFYVE